MRFHILTLFPDMIRSCMHTSIMGRAIENGCLSFEAIDIRDFAFNKHHKVDDSTYGGGAGLLMSAEPVFLAWQSVADSLPAPARCIYLCPQGKTFDQAMARELSGEEDLIFLCGHYEGIDERVIEEIVTDPVSIGDYVLTGGELPALVMMDAISRMIPGVLHNALSGESESFNDGLLEYPQYTKPEIWHGKAVPSVLLSGHHGNVDAWRREQSVRRTALLRPDLLKNADLSGKEKELIRSIRKQARSSADETKEEHA